MSGNCIQENEPELVEIQGDLQTDDQKNQGDSWLLVHVWINSYLTLTELIFEKKNSKIWIIVPIFVAEQNKRVHFVDTEWRIPCERV